MTLAIVQAFIDRVSVLLGVDDASLKVLFCTLLSFPFSFIFKRLPDENYTLKNLYNVGVSAFYVFGVLGIYHGIMTLSFSAAGCYFITRYVRTPAMPWINFLFLMSHLAYNHLMTQFFSVYDKTKIDMSGAQMVLVLKLTAFGWSVYDGRQPVGELNAYNKSRAIKKHPNILPYIGYVFFYASLLTGPSFDYAAYDRFLHSTLFDDVPEDKRPGKRKRKIPRSGRQALSKTLQGAFCATLLVHAPKYITIQYALSPAFVNEHNFIYRIFYLWILSFTQRLRYYTIWLIAEGACILCGLGYNGYDPVTDSFKWDRVQNIDPFIFETSQNMHTSLEAWNMNTNKWLKNYVYLRVARKGKKPGFKSTLFTFVTSAFWHGTRPGYYITFVLGAILQTVGKIFRRNLRPIFLKADGKTPKSNKIYYDIVCYFVTQLTFGFLAQPFVLLEFPKSIQIWSTCYFYVPIISLIVIFLFNGPYKKQVVGYCKSFQDSEKYKNKLAPEEAEIVNNAVETLLEKESADNIPTLGLPPIDYLQTVDKKEVNQDINDLRQAWTSFRGRRGSIKEDDFEGLKDAYNNFTTEINQILTSRKQEFINTRSTKPTAKKD
ncbi:MBOAT, membrane-bound O-acyltransferase family-domain-containing protein [Scheffersomyces coipomensis]|uniref:MBOAT, membrane-bound O-acyltransferase family-domain-containing protein n=1 Tax=Scheffersomyces coipomensis TaxID=1788519 RepID=UPI00315C883D